MIPGRKRSIKGNILDLDLILLKNIKSIKRTIETKETEEIEAEVNKKKEEKEVEANIAKKETDTEVSLLSKKNDLHLLLDNKNDKITTMSREGVSQGNSMKRIHILRKDEKFNEFVNTILKKLRKCKKILRNNLFLMLSKGSIN